MELKRDYLTFYRSFYESIIELDDDMQILLFRAICEYSLNKKEIELKGIPKALFISFKAQLDANNRRYENGKKGGRPKANNNQNETKTKPKNNQNETKTKPKNNQNETKTKPNYNLNKNLNKNLNYSKEINKEKFEGFSEKDFIFFWNLYPKHTERKNALDEFLEINKSESDSIKKGIESYKKYLERSHTEDKYIKSFKNFLKNECWKDSWDELEKVNNETGRIRI